MLTTDVIKFVQTLHSINQDSNIKGVLEKQILVLTYCDVKKIPLDLKWRERGIERVRVRER